MNKDLSIVCRRMLDQHDGFAAQKDIIIGEIGELLTLFGKQRQGRAKKDSWIDEIADVMIALKQLQIMHSISDDEIEQRIDFKVRRTKERFELE